VERLGKRLYPLEDYRIPMLGAAEILVEGFLSNTSGSPVFRPKLAGRRVIHFGRDCGEDETSHRAGDIEYGPRACVLARELAPELDGLPAAEEQLCEVGLQGHDDGVGRAPRERAQTIQGALRKGR